MVFSFNSSLNDFSLKAGVYLSECVFALAAKVVCRHLNSLIRQSCAV